MGCNISSICSRGLKGGTSDSEKSPEPKQYSWDKRENIDLSKYTVDSLVDGETGRRPGSIDGQGFQISKCDNSHIYVYDWTNTVTIDDCKNCKIFLGPVKGSVFLRNCTGCTIVVACGQFRTRDCSNLDVFILLNTQPIVESSSKIRLGCFQFWYPDLENHLKKADINPWLNFWWKVHDFTPVSGEKNWKKLGPIFKVQDFLPLHEDKSLKGIDISSSVDKSVVPLTTGPSKAEEEQALVAVYPVNNQLEVGWACYSGLRSSGTGIYLVRSTHIQVRKLDVERLFPTWVNHLEEGKEGAKVLCLQIAGAGVKQYASTLVSKHGSSSIWVSEGDNAEKDIQSLFGLAEMTLGF